MLTASLLVAPGAAGVSAASPEPTKPEREKVDFELRDSVVEQLGPLQQELAKAFPESFGGLWVNDQGLTTVAVVGDQLKVKAAVQDMHASRATWCKKGSTRAAS